MMKNLSFLMLIAAIAISGCKKEENNIANSGTATINFANEVDGQAIALGTGTYQNAFGNQYKVDLLKYYITNITFIKDDNSEYNINNYDLIDASNPASSNITIDSIPNGVYTNVRFYLGIDSLRNHTGAQEGDLDPINGMIWTWNTGYIFFKHEGSFIDANQQQQTILLHYGTDKALATVTVPLTGFEIKGDNKKLNLALNLNQLYANPNVIDFNVDNIHQSTSQSDIPWLNKTKQNFQQAFTFKSVQ
ncbi:MAG: hypothetical protein M0D57_05095 [Sphingobacteriales bacterium JAD_PAG50586_3]|nr:MAG: hypothetical protein M0D57_05095 [Sphingobacteriales bacterium JAD_PAG50586_3]